MNPQHTAPAGEAPAPRFPGTPVELGGRTYIVPPLSLAQLRTLSREIEQLQQLPAGALSPEAVTLVVTVVHAAVSRNYPDMSRDELEEIVDVTTLFPLISATTGFRTPAPVLQS